MPKEKQTFKDAILPCLIDGFAMDAVITHPSGAKLVGSDHLGNKYFEKENGTEIVGRHRFVVYSDLWNYSAGSVPPEWHHWLNHIGDDIPKPTDVRPFFEVKRAVYDHANPYNAKGSFRTQSRNWRKVEFWTPPAGTPAAAAKA